MHLPAKDAAKAAFPAVRQHCFPFDAAPEYARNASAAQYRDVQGRDIAARVSELAAWYEARSACGIWPYNKASTCAPGIETQAIEEGGRRVRGINLASQDYLSLSQNGRIVEAATEAAARYGVHSAGSAILMGNTFHSRELEKRISDVLGYQHALLYPTGWAAGFGVLRGLVQPRDYVLIDALAHNCLQEGAAFTTKNVIRVSHNNNRHLARLLARIRQTDDANAIFFVTEGLFSMDSDTPDLSHTYDICQKFGAYLIVDVAHDLGVLGRTGRSAIEEAGLLGKVDIVVGSFSKTFASNGGFITVNDERLLKYLRVFSSTQVFSNALSPVQAAILCAAFDIVFSSEGDRRRAQLLANATTLRDALASGGLECVGRASPIVPVLVGTEFEVRVANYLASGCGLLTNIAEYPAVARGKARFRLQVQSNHSAEQMTFAGHALATATQDAREYCRTPRIRA